jgi:Zn-dependent protease
MGKSFKIGTISGIPIKLHWSFFALFVLVYIRTPDAGLEFQLAYGLFILLLFGCITLHELGHALSARRYGVNTIDIILSPIGGVARLTHLPVKPIQEFVVALAGPLVNVAIAIVIFIGLAIVPDGLDWERSFYFLTNEFMWNWTDFARDVMFINVGLVLFNLIPAFPMDGGRIFRALLSIKFSRKLATRIASLLGQAFAFVFIYFSLFVGESDMMLAVIGVFIFMSASAEYKSVKVTETLKEYTASDVMRTDVRIVPSHLIVQQAVNYLIEGEHGDFILEDENERLNGVVLRGKLFEAKQAMLLETPIEALKTNKIALVDPTSNFHDLFYPMQNGKVRVFIVQEEGKDKILGIIDSYAVNQFLHKSKLIKPSPIKEWLQKKLKNN